MTLAEINFQEILFGSEDFTFLGEVLIRSLTMYLVILIGLRLTGKRGVRQLSIFELVVIIGLGSAAGDPMFYKEVGVLPAMTVFAVVIGFYRLTTFLTAKSKKVEYMVEGKTVCLIENGRFCIDSFNKEDLGQDEFLSELRVRGVSQLGQVDRAYLEISGEVSVFFFADKDVKPGLPILLHEFDAQRKRITQPGTYACAYCALPQEIKKAGEHECVECGRKTWVKAVDRKRIV